MNTRQRVAKMEEVENRQKMVFVKMLIVKLEIFLLKARYNAEHNILWKINRRNCNMWWDNFFRKALLLNYIDCAYNVKHSVKEYISNGIWNMHIRQKLFPDNIVHHVGNISIGDEYHSDYAIWKLTQYGFIHTSLLGKE